MTIWLLIHTDCKAIHAYTLNTFFSIWEFIVLVAFLSFALSEIYEQIACLHGLHIRWRPFESVSEKKESS